MRNNFGKLLVLFGFAMLISAAVLCVHNIQEGRNAGTFAETAVSAIKQNLPEKTTEPVQTAVTTMTENLFAPYETTVTTAETTAEIVIDGRAYCGYLTIPALGLELPVRSGWSYPALKESPCRVSGSAQTHDLVIAAHNYPAHFGRISALGSGDQIVFTDAENKQYSYTVAYTEIIAGTAPAQMFSGEAEEWDLTLFTCTLSGQSRVTVRANLVTDDSAAE